MMKLLRNKKGFTLVEIMIVVAIIGLLAAIAIPNFIKSRNRSRDAVCINNMKQIASALEQVCMENDLDATGGGSGLTSLVVLWSGTPAADGWGVVGPTSYLKAELLCPIDAGTYTASTDGDGVFSVLCGSIGSHGEQFQSDYATPGYSLP